jgi:predicted Fe-Mo cluster-binding NifX family protein
MRTTLAIPVWGSQVSTTFDFAATLWVVETEAGREINRSEVRLHDESVEKRARRVRDLAVQVLLCGAVSRPLARAVARLGIQVVPFVTGEVDTVLAAYLCGRLAEPRFLQPGCRPGARRRWRNRGGFCGGRGRQG